MQQLLSEVEELRVEFEGGGDKALVAEEMGDVYFSLGQLCRHLDLDPELVSTEANSKFLRRFALVEKIAKGEGVPIAEASRDVLERFWQEAKAQEKAKK